MRTSAKTAGIQIPPQFFFGDAHFVHALFQFVQAFQIGSLPVLNTLLLQNSPRQLAADRLFSALTRFGDVIGDYGQDYFLADLDLA